MFLQAAPWFATDLARQGVVGLFALLFIVLYLKERKANSDLRDKIDTINEGRINREKEVAQQLVDNTVDMTKAIDRSAGVAEKIAEALILQGE